MTTWMGRGHGNEGILLHQAGVKLLGTYAESRTKPSDHSNNFDVDKSRIPVAEGSSEISDPWLRWSFPKVAWEEEEASARQASHRLLRRHHQ